MEREKDEPLIMAFSDFMDSADDLTKCYGLLDCSDVGTQVPDFIA